jgi:hypothetical protein
MQQIRREYGMEVEYKKDLRHNYLVIKADKDRKIESYCIKILEHQTIDGVLKAEQRCVDNQILFYYDITAKQSMSSILDKTQLSYTRIKQLVGNILNTIEKAYEYLLPEDDFILTPENIYMDVISHLPYLCFYSGYGKSIKEQLNGFLEYLMNKVDYNDKDAVLLVYQLYAVSKEEGFTIDHLLAVLQKRMQSVSEKNNHKSNDTDLPSFQEDDNHTQYSNPEEGYQFKERIQEHGVYKPKNRSDQKNTQLEEAKSKSIAQQIEKNNIFRKPTHEDSEKRDSNIPVMMEKLEGEEEILCYPIKTYLYTGACVFGGIIIMVIGFTSRILFNTFGNRIDYSKLLALLLVVFCIEGYLLKLIWDKKKKISKLVITKEYIDPRQKQKGLGVSLSSRLQELENNNIGKDREKNKVKNKEKVQIEVQGKDQSKIQGNDITQWSEQQSIYSDLLNRKSDNQQKILTGREELSIQEEDYNPTCLLNEASQRLTLVLKSLEDTEYKDIPIKDFPFFIGKLRKNVDYCLEKDVVSRFHAKITKEQEQYYITDLNSMNGTFVNQEPLQTYQKKEIKHGDEIAFANIRYQFWQKNF